MQNPNLDNKVQNRQPFTDREGVWGAFWQSIKVQESEWLRETLHQWLDDEYCPEPTNIDISRVAAKSFYESLTSKETDLGEILLRMITDLEKLSYRESFHGPFSSANAAVRLITEKIGTIADNW